MKPGDKIKAYRNEHHLSLRDFAKKCGLSFSQVRLMEIGRNSGGNPSNISWPSLKKVADAMGITVYELVDGCDDYALGWIEGKQHKIPEERQAVIDKIILATPEQFALIQSYVDFVTK